MLVAKYWLKNHHKIDKNFLAISIAILYTQIQIFCIYNVHDSLSCKHTSPTHYTTLTQGE